MNTQRIGRKTRVHDEHPPWLRRRFAAQHNLSLSLTTREYFDDRFRMFFRKCHSKEATPAAKGIPAGRLERCPGLTNICFDTYMLVGVYQECGICIRNHCGAEPPRDFEPPGLVPTVGGRDRASTSHDAADRVQAPARAAGGLVSWNPRWMHSAVFTGRDRQTFPT